MAFKLARLRRKPKKIEPREAIFPIESQTLRWVNIISCNEDVMLLTDLSEALGATDQCINARQMPTSKGEKQIKSDNEPEYSKEDG